MKWTCLIGTVLGCFVLGAGADSDGPSDREFEDLVKRVTVLEKEVSGFEKAASRMGGNLADFEKELGGLTKSVADLKRTLAGARKDAAESDDQLADIEARFDKRTLRLAEWFDEYNGRGGFSRHHRNEIARTK